MRLLHCSWTDKNKTAVEVAFEEHVDPIPPYAILSHRWGNDEDEVSYADVLYRTETITHKAGNTKLENCCKKALEDGYQYVWIDTCCIDKSSSAELSEAINSMFSWYGSSKVCYAYLDDVSSDETPTRDGSFGRSVWFTRGWTLQEMIAPNSVVFFASDWQEIGSKASLAAELESITRVEKHALLRTVGHMVSVAKRMSWAAGRQTKRIEDRAYSMMGLFGVNMPAIYGEGDRAFVRLQHEIIRMSHDQSIFAWEEESGEESFGMFARSPDQFVQSAGYRPIYDYRNYVRKYINGVSRVPREMTEYFRPDCSLTNVGVRIELPLQMCDDYVKAYLMCVHGEEKEWTWIYLKNRSTMPPSHYVRLSVNGRRTGYGTLQDLTDISKETIVVADSNPSLLVNNHVPWRDITRYRFEFRLCPKQLKAVDYSPLLSWSSSHENDAGPLLTLVIQEDPSVNVIYHNMANILLRYERTGEVYCAVIGVKNWRVWSDVWPVDDRGESAQEIYERHRQVDGRHGMVRQPGLDWIQKSRASPGRGCITLKIRQQHAESDVATYLVKIEVSGLYD